MVKDGVLSPRAALDFLRRQREAGGFVKREIVEWLERKMEAGND
jgi:hypothetical protein